MANSTSTSISTTRTATATSSAAAHSSTSTSSPSKYDPETGYHDGDIAFLLLCTVLVMLMIPGVGFFYSGLSRRKSALSLIFISILVCAVTSIQWFIWGFSLSFSPGVASSGLIGTLNDAFFMGVLDQPFVNSAHPIPDLLFAVYQGLFSAIAVVLAAGAAAERGRLLPCAVFMFVWATLVYDPVACWTWNPHGKGGWAYAMGILDWASGTPVHIVGGCASLAYSMVLGKRKGHGTHELNYRPHNVASVIIGTVFLAVVAVATTNLAACVGGITWCVLDWRLERKWYDYVELTREVGIDGGVAGSITDGVGETGSMFSNAQLRQQQQQQVGRSASPTVASAAGARAFTREDTKDSAILFGSGQPAIYG
ncbi:ammonium transporter AmtB-like domain-containing protein [Pseudoneurospora amorphoporcata]|uniref:Ammonium transporter AmtB-like domain-containing protein n=1 Tax=Pseudoneurospora amorphoporcata TaxID=241081 RepID=A0AAN6SFL2_9PEZI|nr:ammonium transporter AmtB-like domain-containing protein [Pseudoneurospora amorphoporcata]